ADVLWGTPGYLDSLAAVHKMLTGEGVPFGIIYDGNSTDASDAAWIQSATQHMLSVELNLGSPDLVIFQSWHAYPKKLLPESDADSFPSLIDAYFRARTTLTAAVAGGSVQGILTASDSGQALANAPVAISLTPVSGSGVAAVYAAGVTAPPGTQSIIFGARVNMECNCSGAADFLVTSFLLTGGAAPVTGGFANQLAGWGVSTPGTPAASAKMESGGLHVLAAAGQAVMLNSSPLAFTGTGPVTFHVSARVAPQSAGAGYFTAIFLGASGEIARTRIPFAAAELPVAAVATDASGRFTAALPSTPGDSFQVRAGYSGDGATWPSQAAAPYSSPGAQSVAIAAIANAASYDTYAVSPGEIVAVFGNGMGPAAMAGGTFAGGFLGTSIGGVTLRFDGIAAPLIYASDGQIAAIVPYGIHADQTYATVGAPGGVSLPFGIPVVPAVPGLFTADASGFGPLAALNVDGSLNRPANPAQSGLPVVVFGTGEGQTSPAGVDGLVMNVPAAPLLAPAVTVGGVPATVDYFGPAPGEVAGVFQLNFRVPADAPRGDAVPVTVRVGGAGAAKTTTIAIR
ncbi:MAG: hypothetical protein KGN36_10295, partial [Acidobacteriota bacterium]|nr:hypothetical protein [Acidobacteriota bacterium]